MEVLQHLRVLADQADQDGRRSPLTLLKVFQSADMIAIFRERKFGFADGLRDMEKQLDTFKLDLEHKVAELGKPVEEREANQPNKEAE